jgi:hypothetical protein
MYNTRLNEAKILQQLVWCSFTLLNSSIPLSRDDVEQLRPTVMTGERQVSKIMQKNKKIKNKQKRNNNDNK